MINGFQLSNRYVWFSSTMLIVSPGTFVFIIYYSFTLTLTHMYFIWNLPSSAQSSSASSSSVSVDLDLPKFFNFLRLAAALRRAATYNEKFVLCHNINCAGVHTIHDVHFLFLCCSLFSKNHFLCNRYKRVSIGLFSKVCVQILGNRQTIQNIEIEILSNWLIFPFQCYEIVWQQDSNHYRLCRSTLHIR